MSDERLAQIPGDRMLTETDRRHTEPRVPARPGDVAALEQRLAERDAVSQAAIRRRFYSNLVTLTDRAGARSRLPLGFQKAFALAGL